MFITLYGINNIGKSTQVELLVEKLKEKGHQVESIKYPIYNLEPTGPYIDFLLRDPSAPKIAEEELQMWYTLNRYQFNKRIKEKLKKGVTIVAEDYVGTGLAWGISKGAELPWLETLNQYLIPEDIAILMDGERFLEGKEEGHLHEDNAKLVEKCRQSHLQLAEKYGWKTVNANQSKEKVAENIWEIIKEAQSNLS